MQSHGCHGFRLAKCLKCLLQPRLRLRGVIEEGDQSRGLNGQNVVVALVLKSPEASSHIIKIYQAPPSLCSVQWVQTAKACEHLANPPDLPTKKMTILGQHGFCSEKRVRTNHDKVDN